MYENEKYKILTRVLGASYRSGSERLYHCPYCKHHKKKLSVNFTRDVYKCWICDARGRTIRRIVRRFGDLSLLREWDTVSGHLKLSDFDNLFQEFDDATVEETCPLPTEFKTLTNRNTSLAARPALSYLRNRGVAKEDLLKWKIGYALDGEYRNRIIIPSFNMSGEVNYFVARSYDSAWNKYKNPKASRDICFNELYIDWDSDLIIVEGIFDAIVAGNAMPILGSSLRKNSKLIKRIVENDTPVYLALDADAEKKAEKVIQTMLECDIELYKIDVMGYEDVGSMTKEQFRKRKQTASFVDTDTRLMQRVLSI